MIRVYVVTMLLSLAQSASIELCKVSKVWGEASYENKTNCNTVDLKLRANSFTVGGFSSGGYSTANLFAMFNDNIDGIAINAGFGPCATQGYGCDEWLPHKYNTTGIAGKPVFIYSGTKDSIVEHYKSQWTADYFESLGANVSRLWINDFQHIFPNNVQTNEQYGPPSSCAVANSVYNGAQNCGLDMALEIFEYLYDGNLTRDLDYQDNGTLYAIDQKPFNTENAFLADQGFLYVPKTCLNKSCRFHMDIHGCTETIVRLNDTFVRQLGYMEYAAANDIVMLFPQNNDKNTQPYEYCWRGSQQSDKNHPQIVGIGNLIKAVFDRDLLNEGVDPAERPKDLEIEVKPATLSQEKDESKKFFLF